MPKSPTSLTFRREIAACLRKALRENNVSKNKAAKHLGIKRQMLWLYLKGKAAPGPEVLRKASKIWKLTLSNGTVLSPGAFGPEKKPRSQPRQFRLFEILDEIQPNQIKTTPIGRVGDYFEFRVRIKVAS
jgi:transcriptional regulator with XRE-family HTH domain